MAYCECGCGELTNFDRAGRPQRFKRWHQNKMAGFKAGYSPWNKGKEWTPPNIEKFIEGGKKTRYKKGQLSGEKHFNWRGGVTPLHIAIRNSEEGKLWRKEVFLRDNYTCVECGKRGGDLIAYHIKGFANHPELRFELSNGRTLCKDCNYQSTYVLKEWASA